MIKWLKNHWLLEDGAVFRHLQVVPESTVRISQGWIQLHNWKGLLRLRLLLRKVSLSRTTTYVTVHNSYRGYYHWLLESLPKLLEVKRTIPEFTLLLPASYQETFYTATLSLLGIRNVERLHSGTLYQVPQLALPYLAESMGYYSASNLQELKKVLLEALAPNTRQLTAGPKRLYISRRKATRRKVVNEIEVEQVLVEFGFQAICFEDYTFEEQLHLCATAEMLVGIHGAGLSNMVFLPAEATVVEFRKFDDGDNCFFTQLALTLQHTYHLLYCVAEDEQQSVQDADLRVDIMALQAILLQQSK